MTIRRYRVRPPRGPIDVGEVTPDIAMARIAAALAEEKHG